MIFEFKEYMEVEDHKTKKKYYHPMFQSTDFFVNSTECVHMISLGWFNTFNIKLQVGKHYPHRELVNWEQSLYSSNNYRFNVKTNMPPEEVYKKLIYLHPEWRDDNLRLMKLVKLLTNENG